ncbi:MAG TPA: hypothetical protein VMH26_16235 [Burkholderiales bacterium]|nr:hypothetical protein [Burkholderiales bacterium]
MRMALWCVLAPVMLTIVTGAVPATAATFVVDDGASAPQESTALLRWRRFAPSRANDSNTLEGALAVVVRLNLAPWMHRSGRVFLALPEQGTASVRVSWTTQGRLLSGSITPGNRVLVYAGPITTALLEETLTLQIEADGSRLPNMQRLKFHFEIDID